MHISIRIRAVKNGYIIKFYRGFWDRVFARYIAVDKEQIATLISKELNAVHIDVERNNPFIL